MSTSVRKPLISLSLTLGSILTIFGLNNTPQREEPHCQLKVDYPHKSTYLFEQNKTLAIKTNVRTECTLPQRTAKVWMELVEKRAFGYRVLNEIPPKIVEGTYSPYILRFKDLLVECEMTSQEHIFQSYVHAQITLQNGKIEKYSKVSDKSRPINCRPPTKIGP